VSVSEALWFSNNQSMESEFLNGGGDRLVGHLKQIESDNDVARAAFRSVFSRNPDKDETNAVVEYVAARSERREAAIKQVVWAMLSSPEFRFNH
jgi:hypothetical protein